MAILIVDSSGESREQLTFLLNFGGHFNLEYASNLVDGFRLLKIDEPDTTDVPYDLVLIDAFMDGRNGFEILKRIKSQQHLLDVPLIVVTSNLSTDYMLTAFEAGAADYITKPLDNKIELIARVNSAINLKQEIDARKAREKELVAMTAMLEQSNADLQKANKLLEEMASKDGLTEIPNRRYFKQFYNREWKNAVRNQKHLAVAMIDIDFFKAFNDTYGHTAGDECLKKVAGAIQQSLRRPNDLVARYGGEEFILVLPETDEFGATHLALKIREKVADLKIPHQSSKIHPYVTFSMGITLAIPCCGMDPGILIELADKALYYAKDQGRNRSCFYKDDIESLYRN